MNWRHRVAAAVLMAVSSMLLLRAEATEHSNGSVIIEWNDLLQRNIGGPPLGQPRLCCIGGRNRRAG
jgi:hypothetical protein